MSNRTPARAALLERLASHGDPDLFHDVPDVTGSDSHEALSITMDSVRRVVDARVLDLDKIRLPEPFNHAVREAFAAADGTRAYASLQRSGKAEEYLARAEATLSGLSPARAPRPPDMSRKACARRRAARDGARETVRPRPEPVTSDNGYLTIQRGPEGRLVDLTVDAEWLSAATADHLERAIVQAARFGSGD